MAKQWRPAEILNALKRLGFLDKPAVGDHVALFKAVVDHPEGKITVQSGIDMGASPCPKHDVSRIQRQTKIKGAMWDAALNKKLARADYDEHLRGLKKADLVHPFFRERFEGKK